jgi:hypothetical protein
MNVISLKMLRQIRPRRLAIVCFSIRGLPPSCLICMGEQYTIVYTRKMVRSGRSIPSTPTMNSSDALVRDSLRRRIPCYRLRIIYARSKVSMQEPVPLSLNPFQTQKRWMHLRACCSKETPAPAYLRTIP